jgi:hypothetical protein
VGSNLGDTHFIFGLDANAENTGNALVHYRSGTIEVSGNFAVGIFAFAGDGSATVITDPGTTVIVNAIDPVLGGPFPVKPGIDAESTGTKADGSLVTESIASTIQIFGLIAPTLLGFGR